MTAAPVRSIVTTWRTPAVILVCGCLIAILTYGPRSSLGLFMTPLSHDNGWGRDVVATALAIHPSGTKTTYVNDTVAVTGTLTAAGDGVTGRTVVLQKQAGASWTTLATRTSGPGGTLSYAYRPTAAGGAKLRWSFTSADGYLASTSPVLTVAAKVRPTSLAASPARITIKYGKATTVKVRLLSGRTAIQHAAVRLEQRPARAMKYTKVKDLRTGSTGYAAVADRILFDARAPKDATRPGGLGAVFDWHLLEKLDLRLPFMVSGGLNAGNVAEAVRVTRAGGVDVSSGVERAPGLKDPDMIRDFIRAARATEELMVR